MESEIRRFRTVSGKPYDVIELDLNEVIKQPKEIAGEGNTLIVKSLPFSAGFTFAFDKSSNRFITPASNDVWDYGLGFRRIFIKTAVAVSGAKVTLIIGWDLKLSEFISNAIISTDPVNAVIDMPAADTEYSINSKIVISSYPVK